MLSQNNHLQGCHDYGQQLKQVYGNEALFRSFSSSVPCTPEANAYTKQQPFPETENHPFAYYTSHPTGMPTPTGVPGSDYSLIQTPATTSPYSEEQELPSQHATPEEYQHHYLQRQAAAEYELREQRLAANGLFVPVNNHTKGYLFQVAADEQQQSAVENVVTSANHNSNNNNNNNNSSNSQFDNRSSSPSACSDSSSVQSTVASNSTGSSLQNRCNVPSPLEILDSNLFSPSEYTVPVTPPFSSASPTCPSSNLESLFDTEGTTAVSTGLPNFGMPPTPSDSVSSTNSASSPLGSPQKHLFASEFTADANDACQSFQLLQ